MKKKLITFFCFCSIVVIAQKEKSTSLGKTTLEDLKMTVYDKDSTAVAVVLYEHANYYSNDKKGFKKTTDYYFRIKILKKQAFNKATIKISLFNGEEVDGIKAKTYNISKNDNIKESFLEENRIFTKQVNSKRREVSFAMPNVKVGSVIEYVYSITSPNSRIDDWYFQSDIPKVKSDFTAAILGNYKYNIRVVGGLKLAKDSAVVKKNCAYLPIIGMADCVAISYGIDNIPAFIEEDYMLSKRNYISRLNFDLSSYTRINGMVKNYSKTWKAADKFLKNNFLDNQNSKEKYFKKKVLNNEILSIENDIERAKKIFELIKKNYKWNGKYWPTGKINIKKAYENKKGNVFDINLSLYNALQAADIESKLTMLATRGKGLPTKLYPIVEEFNYLVVKVVIDEKVYFLDATKKMMPFGLIQFEALSGEGRVMDFKNGSFWEDIQINSPTTKNTKLMLTFSEENFSGSLIVNKTGYSAFNQREELINSKREVFLENFETFYPSIKVEDFKVKNLNKVNDNLREFYKINIEHELTNANRIRINPFFLDKLIENPFKLNKRLYPIDFGYPRNNTFFLSLKIPEEYSIKKLPENKVLTLPNDGGRIIFSVKKTKNSINLYLKTTIKKKVYKSNQYNYLKEFYNQLIKIQDSFLEIEKINKNPKL